MGTVLGKSFATPDESVAFPNGTNNVIRLDGMIYSKGVFEPGWRWSNDIKPIVQTDSCQEHHRGYVISGHLGVRMNDGEEAEFGPDSVLDIPPGHEGWVIGNEPVVMVEFGSGENFAKPPA